VDGVDNYGDFLACVVDIVWFQRAVKSDVAVIDVVFNKKSKFPLYGPRSTKTFRGQKPYGS
jgi:hypothetical protein